MNTGTTRPRHLMALAVLVFAASSWVAAEVVHLADGRSLEGTIVEATEMGIVLEIGGSKVRFRRERLASPEPDSLAKARAALDDGNSSEAKRLAEILLQWEPTNADARQVRMSATRLLDDQEAAKVVNEMEADLVSLGRVAEAALADVRLEGRTEQEDKALQKNIGGILDKYPALVARYGESGFGPELADLAARMQEVARITFGRITDFQKDKTDRLLAYQKASQDRIVAQKAAEYKAEVKRREEEVRRQRELASERQRRRTEDASAGVAMSDEFPMRGSELSLDSLDFPIDVLDRRIDLMEMRQGRTHTLMCPRCDGYGIDQGKVEVVGEMVFGAGGYMEVPRSKLTCARCGGSGRIALRPGMY